MAVARLTQTWERLPSKLKRTFSQFESLIDPSRNHRRYRIFISKMEPPIIPFMPLFLKDMTFAHEGNKTYLENGLINFEKMVSSRHWLDHREFFIFDPNKAQLTLVLLSPSLHLPSISIYLIYLSLSLSLHHQTFVYHQTTLPTHSKWWHKHCAPSGTVSRVP